MVDLLTRLPDPPARPASAPVASGAAVLLVAVLALAGCAGAGAGSGGPGDGSPAAEGGDGTPAARPASDRLVARGRDALAEGRLAEAAELLERAVRVDPSNGRAYLALAETRHAAGRPEAARGLLERAVGLLEDPDPETRRRIERLRAALDGPEGG